MKHTMLTCAKYKRLRKRLFHHAECTIVGALEMLFLHAGGSGPVMAAVDVEAITDWPGTQGELLAALTDTGDGQYTNFLDVLDATRVEIHDYWDHAPDCVKNREKQRLWREKQKELRSNETLQSVTDRNELVRNNNQRVGNNNQRVGNNNARVGYSNDKPNQTKPNQTKPNKEEEEYVPFGTGEARLIVDTWNVLASECGLSSIRVSTRSRQNKIRARLNDPFFRENWQEAIDEIRTSSFCRGVGGRGWKANIDWFLRPDSFAKLVEGQYRDAAQPTEAAQARLGLDPEDPF